MFVRDAWYIVAWTDERPFARRILDETILLFRDASGAGACARHL
jgi:phenylpropionate dioxygenase-like ring-hydroxylating dioxygenase large terminal subunit